MSNDNPAHAQITDLFSKQHASNEKLDYFMCTVAGALFAYIGQTFSPEKVSIKCSISTFKSQTDIIANRLPLWKQIIENDRTDYMHYGYARDALLLIGFTFILISKLYQWLSF